MTCCCVTSIGKQKTSFHSVFFLSVRSVWRTCELNRCSEYSCRFRHSLKSELFRLLFSRRPYPYPPKRVSAGIRLCGARLGLVGCNKLQMNGLEIYVKTMEIITRSERKRRKPRRKLAKFPVEDDAAAVFMLWDFFSAFIFYFFAGRVHCSGQRKLQCFAALPRRARLLSTGTLYIITCTRFPIRLIDRWSPEFFGKKFVSRLFFFSIRFFFCQLNRRNCRIVNGIVLELHRPKPLSAKKKSNLFAVSTSLYNCKKFTIR